MKAFRMAIGVWLLLMARWIMGVSWIEITTDQGEHVDFG